MFRKPEFPIISLRGEKINILINIKYIYIIYIVYIYIIYIIYIFGPFRLMVKKLGFPYDSLNRKVTFKSFLGPINQKVYIL